MLSVSRVEGNIRLLFAVERMRETRGEFLGRNPWEVVGLLYGVDLPGGCLYLIRVMWTTNSPGDSQYAAPGFAQFVQGYQVYEITVSAFWHEGDPILNIKHSRSRDAYAI